MKRLWMFFVIAGLAGAAGIYLAACASQKGPLGPSDSHVGTSSGSKAGYPSCNMVLTSGSQVAVAKVIQVKFNKAMDPSTFTTSTVQLWVPSTDRLTESPYTFYALSYDAGTQILSINPDPVHNSGAWDNNTFFQIVITTGVRSLSGQQLDGNWNGVPEPDAFDSFHGSFYTGAPANPGQYQMDPIAGVIYATDSNNTTTNLKGGQYLGNFAVASPVKLTFSFVDENTLNNMDVEQSTVWVDGQTLHTNISITDANSGMPVTPLAVTRTVNSITATLNLNPNSRYKVLLHGGLNGIRSSLDPWEPVYRGRYFDGNGNGVAEAVDDSKPCYIQTLATGAASATPPYVTTADVTAYAVGYYWTVVFHTNNNVAMDTSTLNGNNIQFAVGNSSSFATGDITKILQPKSFVYDATTNILTVYFPNAVYNMTGYIKLMISHNVRSVDGLYFDGNQDKVGGVPVTDDLLIGASNSNYGAGDAVDWSY